MASGPAASDGKTSNHFDDKDFTAPQQWNDTAEVYNSAVGRSSRVAAPRLVELANALHPLSQPNARALDLGAGTGSLTHTLAAAYPKLPILATDIAPKMLETLLAGGDEAKSSSSSSSSNSGNITTQVVDMAAPLGGAVSEGAFSHVFSTMALQSLPDPVESGVFAQWISLLAPDGVVAVGVWDFDQHCGPHALWNDAAVAVDPSYVNPPLLPPGHYNGLQHLREGFDAMGFQDVRAESMRVGFDVGKEGFMRFFWESNNPMTLDRMSAFKGDLGKVKVEMARLLDEEYDGGKQIPLYAGLVVGRKPKTG